MDPGSARATAAPSEEELRGAGERIAQLLEELRTMAGPSTWQRVEELVRRLLELYGAGLDRIVGHALAAEREDGGLAARLREDELVSSLLALHGLHPAPPGERVARAIDGLRERLGPDAVELLSIGEDGPGLMVRLRVGDDPGGCPSTRGSLARAAERAVLEAAPEVARVEVEGAEPAARPAAPSRLVQLGHGRGRGP